MRRVQCLQPLSLCSFLVVLSTFIIVPTYQASLQELPRIHRSPLPHQKVVVEKVTEYFYDDNDRDRAQIVLPGGSGKTFIGYTLAKNVLMGLNPNVDNNLRTVIVFLPTLTLIEQTLRAYYMEDPELIDYHKDCLCVCSRLSFTDVSITTSSEKVSEFLQDTTRPKIIFSTYISARVVRDARLQQPFGLCILDEAHTTAGMGSFTNLPLNNQIIPSAKRLFMTGTPRVFTTRKYKSIEKEIDDGLVVRSMDNRDVYGDVAYSLSYKDACEKNITTPIHMIAYRLPGHGHDLPVPHNMELKWKAKFLVDACKKFNLKKIISFSRTNERARLLQTELEKTDYFTEVVRVSGKMTSKKREERYTKLLRPLGVNERIVACNARVMVTGYDLPDCDAVFFADRMVNHVLIRQAFHRATRKSEGKEKGYVIVPLQMPGPDDRNEYKIVVDIVAAMVEQDTDLLKELKEWTIMRGEAKFKSDESVVKLPEMLLDRIASGDEMWLDALNLESAILHVVGIWDFNFGLLRKYKSINNSTKVPYNYVISGSVRLGEWVSVQRRLYYQGRLSNYRISKLNSIGIEWDLLVSEWEKNFELVKNYMKQNNDQVPRSYESDTMKIGNWIDNQRQKKKRGTLANERIAKLEKIGVEWNPHECEWERNLDILTRYVEENDNRILKSCVIDGVQIGAWVTDQRKLYKKNSLTKERIIKLEKIGFLWHPLNSDFERNVAFVEEYIKENERQVPRKHKINGVNLGAWADTKRHQRRNGKLSEANIKKLELIGFEFEPLIRRWEINLALVKGYIEQHKEQVPGLHEINGIKIGDWARFQRQAFKKGKLTKERIKKLDDIGFHWDRTQAGRIIKVKE